MSSTRLQGRILRLCQKELKETIRDRRTIVTLLLMPLLVYPLLSMALNRFLLSAPAAGAMGNAYIVGVATVAEGSSLIAMLEDPRSQPPDEILRAGGGELAEFNVVTTAAAEYENPLSPLQALEQNRIDVAAEIVAGRPPTVTFTAYRGDGASEAARRILVERLQWLRMESAEQAVTELIPEYTRPARIELKEVGEFKKMPLLATVVPLVLVLMTITGAVYPAIDLTAGERERGTMESLMASPVPRFYVLFAKYTAVVTVALLTAIVNLLAMFTTLWAARLVPMLTGSEDFPWIAVLQILGLLILFSGFFSALLLSLTSFAKSFKEAQAYLIPVMLLSLAPAMLSLMPGITLSGAMAIAPLIKNVHLAREILAGSFKPAAGLAAVVSTAAYAAAALAIAARLFGSDAVTRTSQQSIGSLFQRPKQATSVPSPQSAALMLALLVPIYFVVSNLLIRGLEHYQDSISISARLILNAVALIATFGLVPLMATYLGRNRYLTTYRLRMPAIVSLLGALLLGMGAWSIAHEAFVIADSMGIGGLDEDRIKQALKTLDVLKQAPPWLLILTLALAPAVIEELCFRGYLFSSLSAVLSPGRVIVVTSVLFGVFHVLTGNALLVERFVPTTLLGLILGWIAWRTGSVLPGMVMHFVHNALLELVAHYHERLEFLGADFDDQAHLPLTWLAVTMSIALAGAVLIWAGTRKHSVGRV